MSVQSCMCFNTYLELNVDDTCAAEPLYGGHDYVVKVQLQNFEVECYYYFVIHSSSCGGEKQVNNFQQTVPEDVK